MTTNVHFCWPLVGIFSWPVTQVPPRLYYCVAQDRAVSNRFISLPSTRNRTIGAQLFLPGAEGFLHWESTFTIHSTPPGALPRAQTPERAMAFRAETHSWSILHRTGNSPSPSGARCLQKP
ncbi:glycoside hydrolase domain-containing protein [Arthrobacter sp. AQ5-05]|uniref:glycoside hydrolase domain-containing protein n=1 Tax=Arthrobacter sp. AQ5-05 TaxID=2184581 RepID=UPI003FA3DBF9